MAGVAAGVAGDEPSRAPSISRDGRWVAFASTSDNLVANDSNEKDDVFVHDRQTGATRRVSRSSGGAQGNEAALGKVLGPSVSQEEVPDFVEKLIATYLQRRDSEVERFIDVVRRIGIEPFREQVYGNTDQKRKHRSRQLAAA